MIEIIPAIDIMDGKCVRLEQGDYTRKKDYGISPVEMAVKFEAEGVRRIHVVDLDGAKDQASKNLEVLEAIRKSTNLEIDFSGGIRSLEQIENLFSSGADYLTIGSLAIDKPAEFKRILEKKGPERFILAADSKGGKVTKHGWTSVSSLSLKEFIEDYSLYGIKEVMCTDISKDGMLQGIDAALYKKLRNWFPDLTLIASGGVSESNDLKTLSRIGIDKVIVGKAIYEKRISIELFRTDN